MLGLPVWRSGRPSLSHGRVCNFVWLGRWRWAPRTDGPGEGARGGSSSSATQRPGSLPGASSESRPPVGSLLLPPSSELSDPGGLFSTGMSSFVLMRCRLLRDPLHEDERALGCLNSLDGLGLGVIGLGKAGAVPGSGVFSSQKSRQVIVSFCPASAATLFSMVVVARGGGGPVGALVCLGGAVAGLLHSGGRVVGGSLLLSSNCQATARSLEALPAQSAP